MLRLLHCKICGVWSICNNLTDSIIHESAQAQTDAALMMWKTVFAFQIGLGPAIWRSQLSNYIIVSYLSSNKFPFVFRLDVHVANFGSGHACLLLGPWYRKYPMHLIMNGGILWSLCSFDWRCLLSNAAVQFWIEGNGQETT